MYKKISKFVGLVFLFAALASCNSEASQQQQGFELKGKSTEKGNKQVTKHEENAIRWHYYKDRKNGMVQSRSPVPASWNVSENPDAEIYIKGPGGLTVSQTRTENYAYSNDPFMRQTIRQMGKQVSPVMSLETIVGQYIGPKTETQGYRFVKSYRLPGVVQFWEKFGAGMLQTGSQKQYDALGTEWTNNKGDKLFVLVVQTISSKGTAIMWSVRTTELKASSAHFESAKDDYLHAVANTEINPQWQQVMNGQLRSKIRRNTEFWAQKSQESARAHQQRMAAIQSWGNTSRSIAKTYSDISDISHAGYLKRSNINSAGHQKTVNMVAGQTMIGNHDTGEHYTVDAGSKYYWINNNGEYFGTDNALYDPRIDNKINSAQWTKFSVEQ